MKITTISVQVNEIPLFTGQIAKTDPTHNCGLYSVQTGRLALRSGETRLKLGYLYPVETLELGGGVGGNQNKNKKSQVPILQE